ncbi:hypothetical protein D3C78_1615870 [compost metagenome]
MHPYDPVVIVDHGGTARAMNATHTGGRDDFVGDLAAALQFEVLKHHSVRDVNLELLTDSVDTQLHHEQAPRRGTIVSSGSLGNLRITEEFSHGVGIGALTAVLAHDISLLTMLFRCWC